MNTPTLIVHSKATKVSGVLKVFKPNGVRVTYSNMGIQQINAHRNAVHLIWGCNYKPHELAQIDNHGNVFWMENGWLTQDDGCYIDPMGTNANSSLVGAAPDFPIDPDLDEWIAELHKRHDVEGFDPGIEDYIFVPLQMEHDTQIMYHSNIDQPYMQKQRWMLEQICKEAPEAPIVVRPHPRHPEMMDIWEGDDSLFKAHPNIHIRHDGNSYQWCSKANVVSGVNSTVLTEALTFGMQICYFGEGIMTDNKVMYNYFRPNEPTLFHTDMNDINRYLSLLKSRQIPYDVKSDQVDQHPILKQMIDTAHELAKGGIVTAPALDEPIPRGGRGGMHVYGSITWDENAPPHQRDPNMMDVCVNLITQRADGLIHIAEKGPPDTTFKDTIPYLTCRELDDRDEAKIHAIMNEGHLNIGVGNFSGEWVGDTQMFERYRKWADRIGFNWWCTLTQRQICDDMRRPHREQVRNLMIKHSIPGICFSGNVLLGYVYADFKVPDQGFTDNHTQRARDRGCRCTSFSGINLHGKYGLDWSTLANYLKDTFIITGAGGQAGVEAGTMIYARDTGFRGVLIRPPFNMDDGWDMEVNKPADKPPTLCGIEDSGYL